MKLVAFLRVKNAKSTIDLCLTNLSRLVDEIVVVDNSSTDGTIDVYRKFKKIVAVKKTTGFNEGHDKILAHQLAKKRNPDWILWHDADEFVEEFVARPDLDKLMNSSLNLVNFRLFHFWLSKKKYRVDGPWHKYTAFPQRQMWRNFKQAHFSKFKFHTGGIKSVPGRSITSVIRVKHLGYITNQQISSKKKTYSNLEKHPRSSKTINLDLDEQDLKLSHWQPGKTNAYKSWAYWGLVQKQYQLSNYLATRLKFPPKTSH